MRGLKLNQLDIKQIARLALYVDDPYGDGIRLEHIRNPSEAHLAALRILNNDAQFWDEELVREEYLPRIEKYTNKDGRLAASVMRNCQGLV
jgi:hypothetical protein